VLGRLSLAHYTTHLSNLSSSAAVVFVAPQTPFLPAPFAPVSVTQPESVPELGRHDQLRSCLKVTLRPEHHLTFISHFNKQHPHHLHTFFAARALAPPSPPPPQSSAPVAALSLTAIVVAVLPWGTAVTPRIRDLHPHPCNLIVPPTLVRHRTSSRSSPALPTHHPLHFHQPSHLTTTAPTYCRLDWGGLPASFRGKREESEAHPKVIPVRELEGRQQQRQGTRVNRLHSRCE
jgi:hypothetical protein